MSEDEVEKSNRTLRTFVAKNINKDGTSYLFLTIKLVSLTGLSGLLTMKPLSFEKDDDTNGHIDFITAASVRLITIN